MSSDIFDVGKTITENLARNSREVSARIEVRLGVIDSIIRDTGLDSDFDIAESTELLRFSRQRLDTAAKIEIPADAPKICIEYMKRYSTALNTADKVSICKLMCMRLNEITNSLPAYRLIEPERESSFDFDNGIKIAYRKAYGADVAFEKFASVIPDAVSVYRDTFPGVCDSVALEEADMCILPYENTADGKLLSFYRLIESYELKIAASCMVKSANSEDETRYLLLSPNISGLCEISGITDFEFSIVDRNGGTLAKVLSAVNLLGMRVLSVDTIKADSYSTVFDIRVFADNETLNAFLVYLRLEAYECSPLGLYAATE